MIIGLVRYIVKCTQSVFKLQSAYETMNQSSKTSYTEKLRMILGQKKKQLHIKCPFHFKSKVRPLGFISDFIHHCNRKNWKNIGQVVDDLHTSLPKENNCETRNIEMTQTD